jgi:Fe-S cluster biogenesis protein NfuA
VSQDRIEVLLGQLRDTAEPATLARVEELVERLLELYGQGLGRVLSLLADGGAMTESLKAALTADPLVSGLLTLHGLNPVDVTARVEAALERVRPLLGAHAGGVALVNVDDRRVVHLRLEGACDGCASSRATLEGLVRQAIEDAAPEVAGVEVEGMSPATHAAPLVQLGRRAS